MTIDIITHTSIGSRSSACDIFIYMYYIWLVAYFDVHPHDGYSASNKLSASLNRSVVHLDLNYSKVVEIATIMVISVTPTAYIHERCYTLCTCPAKVLAAILKVL